MNSMVKLVTTFFLLIYVCSCESPDPDLRENESSKYDRNLWNALFEDGVDTNDNGLISDNEAKAVITLNISGRGITDLKGLKFLINLEYLDCSENDSLSGFDFSSIPRLKSLNCQGCNFDSLEIVNCDSLLYLDCSDNQLSNLNVSRNTSLEYLNCSLNPMTALDLSHNSALKYVDCKGLPFTNSPLQTLNVSNCISLDTLRCSNTSLSSLDVSDCITLKYLNCVFCLLTQLNISNTTELTHLSCSGGPKEFRNNQGATEISNQLTSLDLSDCISLERLYCRDNQISQLDILNCTLLKSLSCYGNELSSLNLSNCTSLEYLRCQDNNLTSLNLSNCTFLTFLNCSGNYMSNLDISNCTLIEELYIEDIESLTQVCISTIFSYLPGQIIETDPEIISKGQPITIYFNSDNLNPTDDLYQYEEDLYAHTGVTINGAKWQNVIQTWGNNTTQPQLEYLGSYRYKFEITPDIESYYPDAWFNPIPEAGVISELGLVIRNASASAKTSPDYFIQVFSGYVNVYTTGSSNAYFTADCS